MNDKIFAYTENIIREQNAQSNIYSVTGEEIRARIELLRTITTFCRFILEKLNK